MNHNELIERLLVLPRQLSACERELIEIDAERADAARELQATEDALLLGGTVDGKNAEQRAAQVRAMTASTRALVALREQRVAAQKVHLHHLQAEHSSLRAIARLLAAGAE